VDNYPVLTKPGRSNVLGTWLTQVTLDGAVELIRESLGRRSRRQICVLPVSNLIWAQQDPRLQAIYNDAYACLADGVPVVWASCLLRQPLPSRVTGYDLLPLCLEKIPTARHFFLGSSLKTLRELEGRIRSVFPSIFPCGFYSPPFREAFSVEENRLMHQIVNDAGTEILWVSLTSPKQDYWIAENLAQLNVSVAIGVGAAFEVLAGVRSRAPMFIRDRGFEWLYRMMVEPRRLMGRYLPHIIPFVGGVFRQLISSLLYRR